MPKESKFAIFCDLTSIRGVQRIRRAQTPFIRIIWSIFVFLMTGALIITIGFLAKDFFSYTTAWNSRNLIDDKTDFPAITICAHNPFSLEANRIWEKESILTPSEFNRKLSAVVLAFVQSGNPDKATLLLHDTSETYFANLKPEESELLGHQANMFPHCMLQSDGTNIMAENCTIENDTGFIKQRFSHPKFFNCWTIETAPGKTSDDTSRLTLLLSLVPSKDINESRKNFVMDTFMRGEGVKVVVHQSGTYPEIDKDGINLQPGRMNELSYNTEYWVRLKTPKNPCVDNAPPITDMGRSYLYRFTQCLDSYLQNISINQCGCVNSEWPRPINPSLVNTEIPYCSALLANTSDKSALTKMVDRYNCIYDLNVKVLKETAIKERICIPHCSYYTYPISASIASWNPIPEKLQLYTDKFKRVERLINNPNDQAERERLIKYLKHVIKSEDGEHTKFNTTSTLQIEDFQNQAYYTYISLVRASKETKYHEERLIFDIYILISRIGGLCSIFIGLTAAIFVELIEFIYVVYWQPRIDKVRENVRVESHGDEQVLPLNKEHTDSIIQSSNNNNNNNENRNQKRCVV
ncbi:unnamed protein product [Hymenolepis diminuta]|uniref:Amiloride-sensitive sodium channel n=1 Tax=Hymenolepis diminuta TaxID=6216 RepID=A0A0R3STS6_HYMDI|nr:unnamed protein product [Hymenolepis diminuta]VUZ51578.1 unnamed protein product [Hymenolepis diminuta]